MFAASLLSHARFAIQASDRRGDMQTVYYAVHAALIGGILFSLIWRLSHKQRIEDFGMDSIMIALIAVVTLVGFALGRAFLTT